MFFSRNICIMTWTNILNHHDHSVNMFTIMCCIEIKTPIVLIRETHQPFNKQFLEKIKGNNEVVYFWFTLVCIYSHCCKLKLNAYLCFISAMISADQFYILDIESTKYNNKCSLSQSRSNCVPVDRLWIE